MVTEKEISEAFDSNFSVRSQYCMDLIKEELLKEFYEEINSIIKCLDLDAIDLDIIISKFEVDNDLSKMIDLVKSELRLNSDIKFNLKIECKLCKLSDINFIEDDINIKKYKSYIFTYNECQYSSLYFSYSTKTSIIKFEFKEIDIDLERISEDSLFPGFKKIANM